MLLSFEIKKWEGYSFPKVDFEENNINDLSKISILGSCLSGKTKMVEALEYVKSIIVSNTPNTEFFNSDITLIFRNNENKYQYQLKTDATHITSEELYQIETKTENPKLLKQNKDSHFSIITSKDYKNIYKWFKHLDFVYPIHNKSTLDTRLDKMIQENDFEDSIFAMYQDEISLVLFWEKDYFLSITNDTPKKLKLSNNGKDKSFSIKDLSFPLKEFLYYLSTIYHFLKDENDKILIIDDIRIIANGLICELLNKKLGSLDERINVKKQLIVFSNMKDKNIFTKVKISSSELKSILN